MSYFLLFLLVALCFGGYYEYDELETRLTSDERQLVELRAAADDSAANQKKLEEENDRLTHRLSTSNSAVDSLTRQLAEAKAPKPPPPPVKKTEPEPPPKVAPPSNQLGSLVDRQGKRHAGCRLLKIQNDGIVINSDDGVIKLPFTILPKELQARFRYDATKGSLSDQQVQELETQRIAADSTSP